MEFQPTKDPENITFKDDLKTRPEDLTPSYERFKCVFHCE